MKDTATTSLKTVLLASLTLSLIAACAGSGDAKFSKSVSNKNNADNTKSIAQIDTSKALTKVTLLEKVSERSPSAEFASEPVTTPQLNSIDASDKMATSPTQHTLYFPSDISEIDNMDYAELKLHADFLLENPDVILNINGHTDSQGSDQYNMALSAKRAAAIASFLDLYGVPDSQLILAAHGEKIPATDMSDWDANRRVELEYADPMTLSSRE